MLCVAFVVLCYSWCFMLHWVSILYWLFYITLDILCCMGSFMFVWELMLHRIFHFALIISCCTGYFMLQRVFYVVLGVLCCICCFKFIGYLCCIKCFMSHWVFMFHWYFMLLMFPNEIVLLHSVFLCLIGYFFSFGVLCCIGYFLLSRVCSSCIGVLDWLFYATRELQRIYK